MAVDRRNGRIFMDAMAELEVARCEDGIAGISDYTFDKASRAAERVTKVMSHKTGRGTARGFLESAAMQAQTQVEARLANNPLNILPLTAIVTLDT